MIFIAGITIAVFIAVLLLVKKEKSNSDVLLCFWMFLYAIHIAFFYLYVNDTIYDYPFLLGLQFPLPFLHGVLLYFYVTSVTKQKVIKKRTVFLHLIPTILIILYLIPFLLLPTSEKIEVFKNKGKGYETFQAVLLIAVCISGIIYVYWSIIVLKEHKKRIRDQFSTIEKIDLRWLQFLTYGLGGVWALVIITQEDNIIFLGSSIFVILIGFFGVQQKNIFDTPRAYPQNVATPTVFIPIEITSTLEKPKEKYAKSGLSDELAEEQYQNLILLMNKEAYYKNSNLSLSQLALELNIHSNYLSQIINEKEGVSFYSFVNRFRVDEFKRLVAIPENRQYTLIALAYECGFQSKSSFNRYFKKMTGQTPSQYVKFVSK